MSITINFLPRKKTLKEQVWKGLNIIVAVTTLLNVSGAAIWFQPRIARAATTSLSTQILSWSTVGLDSNKPVTDGPHSFLVQARVTNTGAAPATNVQATFAFGAGTSYLSLTSTAAFPLNTISAGASKDVFYVIKITPPASPNTPSNDAFGKTRPFTITASSPDAANAAAGQTLLIEKLNSQNRNSVASAVVSPASPLVGQPFTVTVVTTTTGGGNFDDVSPLMTYNPSLAALDSVTTHYDIPGQDETDIYANLVGGTMTSVFHFRALAAGNQDFYYLIYDKSGGSHHYNADFGGAITVPVQPRQALTKTVNKAAALPGESLTYTLNYANLGNVDLTNVVITETYSSKFTFGSAVPAPTSGNNVWAIGNLAVGASGSITINGTLTGPFSQGATNVHNVAVMTSTQTAPIQATADTTVTAVCTLTLTKSVNKTVAAPGEILTYTLQYANTGNTACTGGGVRLDDVVPTETTYVAGSNTQTNSEGDPIHFGYAEGGLFGPDNATGYNPVTKLLSWDAEAVVPGETGTVTYQATVNTPTQCGQYDIPNNAKIYADQIPTGVTSNTVHTSVTTPCSGTLTVIKTVINDNGGTKVAGNFTLHVSNGTPANFAGSASGTPVSILAGQTFNVTEDADSGYTTSMSGNCSGTMTAGANLVCTVTNNDKPGTLIVKKVVINDNGGNAVAADFSFKVNAGSTVIFEADGQNDITVNAGTYSVIENSATGYSTTYDNCSNVQIPNGGSATCTVTNNDVAPTIKLNKVVINNNGGNAGVNDFGLTIGGTSVTSGQTLAVAANTPIALNEAGLTGYSFVSLTGDAKCPAVLNGTVTLNEGENVTCTITNDDIAPTITLNKVVTNNNGGTAGVNDFGLTIGGTSVTSGQTLAVAANTPIALNEAGLFGYTFVSLTGDAKCPAVLNGTVTLNEGENVTCTITNDDIAPKLTVYKIVINNDGGSAVSSDFTLGVNAINATPSQFAGSENGTLVTLNQGSYEVTEEYVAGYSPSFSTDCVGSIAVGQEKSCYVTNTDDTPHLMVVKHVINDNGGTKVADDFTMLVNGTNVSDNSFPGEENGTTVSLNKGSYSVSESGPTGYAASYSADCSGTIALGQTKICTVTNNDIAPELTVIKHVVNDNGGNNVAADFTMQVSGTNVSDDEFAGDEAGTTVTLNQGAYSVGEIGLSGYVGTFSADCSGSIAVGEKKICTVTNNDEAASITLSKFVVNNNGGTAGVNDFGLTIGGVAVNSGDTRNVASNSPIALNEAGLFGYNFVSIGGDAKCPAVLGGTVTLNEGEHVSCTITNNDISPELTVIKHVVNDNGGNNVAADFTMQVSGTNVSDDEFAGDEAGTTVTLNQGAYSVDEAAFVGYAKSIGQNCVGSINVGEKKTCTITNNDIAPSITLNKVVTNDNGGKAGVNDFGLTIGGIAVDSGDTLNVEANTPVAINEAGLFGYTFVSITGDEKCPAVLNGTVTLNEGENITCTITNDDIQPKLTVTKVVINDNGGNAVVTDFPLWVDATSVVSGAQNGFNADSYVVSESTNINYTSTITGDCDAQGNVILAVGDEKACTITNNDIAADIAVTKNGPATVLAGDSITYTINWEVLGPGFAKNAVLVDTLPTNVSFDTASNNGAAANYDSNSNTVTWNLGTLAAPATGSETVTVKTVDPSYNGTLVHNEVDFTTDDDEANDDHDTTIVSDFEVLIDKVAPATVESGANLIYTLNWSVGGNAPIDELIITDTLPANTTFVSASNGGTELNGTVTWNLGAQNADASGSLTLTVKVTNLLLDGTIITNIGSVCAASTPSQREIDLKGIEHCDDDTTTTEVNSDFTVNVVKTDNIDPVLAGGQVTYTLAWSTSGNAPISNLIITDTIPANTTFVSASNGGTLSNGKVTWNLGPKTPGDFGSVTITLQAASPVANGTVITNIATVCGTMFTSQEQVVQHCDDDDETTTITSTPSISITKTNNVAGFTNPGKTVTYTVVVTNAANATDTANAVIMTDVLPAGFTFADTGLGTKSFNLGNIAPGASVTTTYVVNISGSQAAGIYTNTASAQGSNTGKVNASSNVEVRLPQILGSSTSPELTITKRVSPTIANPGKIISYTVIVKNIGDADADNVVVVDTLPKGFTFVDGGTATKTWKLGTLEINHERVLNYQVKVGENVKAGNYTNVAVVTADGMSEEARATVEVKVPKVLGLATTGASARDYAFFLLGISMIALGGFWMNRQRRSLQASSK